MSSDNNENIDNDSNFSIPLEAIEEYCRFSYESGSGKLYSRALNVFMSFPGVKATSFFLMNDSTFEFDHKMTVPSVKEESILKIYDDLVEKDIVGSALNAGVISYDDKTDYLYDGTYYMAAPMLKSDGILGIILLSLEKSPSTLDQQFFVLCNIQVSLFATTLENSIIRDELDFSKKVVEQEIALRTADVLQSRKQLADQFISLQSDLSMSLPHEFRTPINQIFGLSDFMVKNLSSLDETDSLEMLVDIRKSAERLKELTENYIMYANLLLIANNVYDIAELQKKVTPSSSATIFEAAMNRADIENRKADLEINLVDAPLKVSEEYLHKLVQEIVNNSLSYSESGTKIEINSDRDPESPDMFEIIFIDNGRGMSKEQIEQIGAYMQFERDKYEQQGAGLGLSIVLRIIDLHDGKISFHSDEEQGTTVVVTFPIDLEMEKMLNEDD